MTDRFQLGVEAAAAMCDLASRTARQTHDELRDDGERAYWAGRQNEASMLARAIRSIHAPEEPGSELKRLEAWLRAAKDPRDRIGQLDVLENGSVYVGLFDAKRNANEYGGERPTLAEAIAVALDEAEKAAVSPPAEQERT